MLMIINQNIQAILRTFLIRQKKKYEKRYPKQFSTTATTVFLSKVPNRKKISNEHSSLCEVEVSLNEILNSINSDKNNKSPGNDDLTSEFFTHFQMN